MYKPKMGCYGLDGWGGPSYLDVRSLQTIGREASNILFMIFFSFFRPFIVIFAILYFQFQLSVEYFLHVH
jgi:hypothetical protein